MAAGKGGGSWKVAYADFVTAMMAFFLVMWIGAQDTKIRQSVANYFVDPSGVSKKPVDSGAVMETLAPGSVAKEKKVDSGHGIRTPTSDPPSPTTRAILNWISGDERRQKYWQGKAQKCREAAAGLQASNETVTPEELAVRDLMSQLKAELVKDIPASTPDVYRDLMFQSLTEVNWDQVARTLTGN